MDDADLDHAIALSSFASYFNAGQTCISASRIYVHEKVYDEFIAKSVDIAKTRRLGSQFDP